MFSVLQTEEFETWLDALADRKAVKLIRNRLLRIEGGLLGDVEPVGEGVSEIRIHYGPGYRIYFVLRQRVVIVLLCGGDKSTQRKDIKRAKALAAELDATGGRIHPRRDT